MRVIARYYGFFSTVTRKLYENIELDDRLTVKDLMKILAKDYGYRFSQLCFIRPLYSEKDFMNICLNTLDLNSSQKFPDGMDTMLNDGDIISFGVMGGAA